MTRLQRLRTWIDEKAGRAPDRFDLKSVEILRSPTASEAEKKEVRRLVRSYDRRWALEGAALAAAPMTAMTCLIAGLPMSLVFLVVGCQTTAAGLFWLQSKVAERHRQKLAQAAWAIHGSGTTAGLYQLFTM